MRLYYRAGTGRPFRVAWALEEIGVPYEAIRLSPQEAAAPEHLARSPLGRVPALSFDDPDSGDRPATTLFDSTAIVLALADRFSEAELIVPAGSPARWQAYQWCLTAQTELEKPAVNALRGYDVPAQRDGFAAAAAAFGAALDGREFLVADRFGVADIVFAGALLVGGRVGWLGGDDDLAGPRLLEYLDALRARPAFARSLQRTESIFR